MPDATPEATPEATPPLDHTPHSDLPPPGRRSSEPVERFAAALDAVVLGAPTAETTDSTFGHLVATSERIQQRAGVWMTFDGPHSATTLGEDRKQRMWEDLMAHHAPTPSPATAPTAHPAPLRRLGALMQPWITIDDERPARRRRGSTGPLRFMPDPQPAITFAMVIAVLIAIGAAFSSLVDPGNPGVTPTASAEGIAGLAGQASPEATPPAVPPTAPAAAPAAAPTADPGDEFQRPVPVGDDACPAEPRPIEEIAAFLRDPGPVTPRAYLPASTPDPAVAEEVARAGRTYLACAGATPLNTDRALQTPRFIYEDRANAFFREAGGATDKAAPEEREQLASLVLGEDPWASQTIVTELAISLAEYEAAGYYDSVPILPMPGPGTPSITPPRPTSTPTIVLPAQVDQTFRPEQAVQLADGRIAIPPTYLVDPADVEAWRSASDDTYPAIVWFDIFARDDTRDGQWSLDERLNVCLGNGTGLYEGFCDDFYEDVDPTGDALFPALATPSASPEVTSPPATPTPGATPAARTPLGRGI